MDLGIGKAIVDLAFSFLKKKLAAGADEETKLRIKIERHLNEAFQWSGRIQFYGMARAEETQQATIALRLNAEPRRFRSALHKTKVLNESTMLGDARNYLLLGDPGAGKTTTLKRITRRLLLDAPNDSGDIYQFPVVLRLRDIEPLYALYGKIATELGIPFSETPVDLKVTPQPHAFWVKTERLQDVIASFLSTTSAVLILDGLDEVAPEIRPVVDRQLSWLALNVSAAKLIVSCRSGDYTRVIEGFDLLEICPLTTTQIRAIAHAWLGNSDQFFKQLKALPYQDLLDRPLLLTQLLFIFSRYGSLPEQPNEIYKRVITLLLQEWDVERGIARKSKYAAFDPVKKAAFLAALSYYLTYRIRAKRFSSQQLADAYQVIHTRFGLPSDEMAQVVAEIETHTGIISVAGYADYEFSHLSLQEYLCGDYLVREPFAEHLLRYLIEYPSPVAVAVTLSSNPSAFFAALFLRVHVQSAPASVHSFLTRLLLERPLFSVSHSLGVAMMKLYYDAARTLPDIREVLDRFLELPCVKESVAVGLQYFRVRTERLLAGGDFLELQRDRAMPESNDFPTPEQVYLPVWLFNRLVADEYPGAQILYQSITR